MKTLVATAVFVVTMLPGTAWAGHAPPPGGDSCSRACGGNFGTWMENSPVVVCAVPNSCTFTQPGAKP